MQKEVFVLAVDYVVEENKPVIRIFGRDRKGDSVVVFDRKFEPYFYVIPSGNMEKLKKEIESLEFDEGTERIRVKKVEVAERKENFEAKEVLKVFAYIPAHVPRLKNVIKTFEGVEDKREFDVLFPRRYTLDKRIPPLSWISVDGEKTSSELNASLAMDANEIKPMEKEKPHLKILAFDIETFSEDHGQKIILLSAMDNSGYKKVLAYEKDNFRHSIHLSSEKELIEKFVSIVRERDPDMIVTYNGDGFDFQVLRERAGKHKVSLALGRDDRQVMFQRRGLISAAMITGRVHIDLYNFVARIMKPSLSSEVLTLDSVANEILGERKDELSWEQLIEYWEKKKKLDKIAEYCLRDSELTLKLSEKIIPNIFALSGLTWQLPFDVSRMSYGQLVESFIIKKAVSEKKLVPNRPAKEAIEQRRKLDAYKGAFVYEPKAGMHENLVVFDFRSLYPSIIVSHNIDGSTLRCKCCASREENKVPGRDYYFCTSRKGFLPSILEEIIDERIRLKKKLKKYNAGSSEYAELDARQHALKTVSNAFYGYFGFFGSRWHNREVAEAITAFGRHYIQETIKMAEKMGFEVIYGDSDSVFLKFDENIRENAKRFLENVNRTLPGIMELELQGIYTRGIFVSKKVGVGAAKKRYALIDREGNVTIRGFEKVRRDWSFLAKKTQETVLGLVLNNKKDEAVKRVQETIQRIKNKKVDIKELVIYTQMTRPMEAYAQVGPHVAAARKAKARGVKIKTGDTIAYVVTPGKGSISDRAELIQFAQQYDSDYYINNQVLPSALRVLAVLGVTEDELMGKSRQMGLGGFGK